MKKPVLAIIIPCFNEELCVKPTSGKLLKLIDDMAAKKKVSPKSFLYFVDDGSTDKTWEMVEKLHKKNNRAAGQSKIATPPSNGPGLQDGEAALQPLTHGSRIKGMRFIRNFGNQKALIAGLEAVRELGCDCAVSIDADLQQDEGAIERFVDEYAKGADIVAGIRNRRDTDTWFKKWSALAFYKTMNLLGVKIPANHSDYRLVSRRALDIMGQYGEKYLFLRGFFNEVGLKTAYVTFDVKPRLYGESKFTFVTLAGLALNGITSYSIVPLRIITVVGFLMAIFGFGVGLWTVFEKLLHNNNPDGLATAIILSSCFVGVQLFCLGVIGEYVGQVYREVKGRPRYIKDMELR